MVNGDKAKLLFFTFAEINKIILRTFLKGSSYRRRKGEIHGWGESDEKWSTVWTSLRTIVLI